MVKWPPYRGSQGHFEPPGTRMLLFNYLSRGTCFCCSKSHQEAWQFAKNCGNQVRRVSFRCDSRKRVGDGKSVLNLLESLFQHPAWPTRWRSTRYTCCTRFIMCFFGESSAKIKCFHEPVCFQLVNHICLTCLTISSSFCFFENMFHFILEVLFFITKKSETQP